MFLATDLVKDTNKILFKNSEYVKLPLSQKHRDVLASMIDHVRVSQDEEKNKSFNLRPAVGIAAVQVGHLLNMFFVKVPNSDDHDIDHEYALINPKIISHTSQLAAIKYGEGCLSVDKDREGLIKRFYKVIIKGYDYLQKKEVTITARGYLAIVLQHEMDHLKGKVYYHHINTKSPWKEEENLIIIK